MHVARILAAAALIAAARIATAQAFSPGEETVLSVRYLGIPTGEGRISVGQPAGEVWPIVFQAKTEGVAALFDIREHLVSYWDAAARRTIGCDLRAYEVGDFHSDRTRIDRVNHTATFERDRKSGRYTKKFDVPADVHDLTSAFMWLRLQPLAPGLRFEIPVLSEANKMTVIAEVVGREPVETPAGTFDALKVQVRTAFEGKFSTKRDSHLWLSDDPRHVVVRIAADFAVGSLVATLKSYRPGTPVASR
ncbi:MAG TPA: DUF3108 domain-containing protein [Anaeromyxobacter sp.]